MDPDRLCDRDDGDLDNRRTAGLSRRLLQAVVGTVCWGIGTGAQDR